MRRRRYTLLEQEDVRAQQLLVAISLLAIAVAGLVWLFLGAQS